MATTSHPRPTCPPDAADCFGCKVQTVGAMFTINGHAHADARAVFHGPTIAERRRKAVAEATANGQTVEQVTRPYTGR